MLIVQITFLSQYWGKNLVGIKLKYGDWLREGRGWGWDEIEKWEKAGTVIVWTIKINKY